MKQKIKEIVIALLVFAIIGSFGSWEIGDISLVQALLQSVGCALAIYIICFFDKKRAAKKATQQPNL